MKRIINLYLAFTSFLLFLVLITSLGSSFLIGLDSSVSNFVVGHQISWLNNLSVALSIIFEPIYISIIILVVACVLLFYRKKKEAGFLAFVSIVSAGLIYLLKHILERPRPLIQFFVETGYSFPSGHSVISVVLFGSLIFFILQKGNSWKKYLVLKLSLLGIFVVGLSRLYLNVHWLSDVIGGYFLGMTVLFLGIYLHKTNIFQKLINLFYPK